MKTVLSSVLAAVRPGSIPAADLAVEPAPAALSGATEQAGSILSLGADPALEAAGAAVLAAASAPAANPVGADAAYAAGYHAACERFAAVLGADGIAGNAKRMGAALELTIGSPAMAAETVVAFVSANVGEATAAAPAPAARPAASYEQRRLDAAALTTPNSTPAKADAPSGLNPGAVFAHRRAHNVKKEA